MCSQWQGRKTDTSIHIRRAVRSQNCSINRWNAIPKRYCLELVYRTSIANDVKWYHEQLCTIKFGQAYLMASCYWQNCQPAIVYMESADFAPNSPISIIKHVRCPGLRKLIGAFKERGDCIIRSVDEYMTSQYCAKCFTRFPRWTKSKRFKTCNNCQQNPIITNVSKRVLQMQRAIMKVWKQMSAAGHAMVAALTQRWGWWGWFS